MGTMIWVVGSAVVVFAAWWVIIIGLSIAVPPEVSGKTLLKQELKRHGVDVARIPERALEDIVQCCLSAARGMAMMNQLAKNGRQEKKNWRTNFVLQIQSHVPIIQNIIAGGRPSPGDEEIREILVRNGVVRF